MLLYTSTSPLLTHQPLSSPKDRGTLNKSPPSSYQLLEHLSALHPPIHPFPPPQAPLQPSPSSTQAHMQDQQHSRRRSWSSHFVTSQQSDYKAPNNVNPPPRPNMHLWDSHISFKTDDVSYIIPCFILLTCEWKRGGDMRSVEDMRRGDRCYLMFVIHHTTRPPQVQHIPPSPPLMYHQALPHILLSSFRTLSSLWELTPPPPLYPLFNHPLTFLISFPLPVTPPPFS